MHPFGSSRPCQAPAASDRRDSQAVWLRQGSSVLGHRPYLCATPPYNIDVQESDQSVGGQDIISLSASLCALATPSRDLAVPRTYDHYVPAQAEPSYPLTTPPYSLAAHMVYPPALDFSVPNQPYCPATPVHVSAVPSRYTPEEFTPANPSYPPATPPGRDPALPNQPYLPRLSSYNETIPSRYAPQASSSATPFYPPVMLHQSTPTHMPYPPAPDPALPTPPYCPAVSSRNTAALPRPALQASIPAAPSYPSALPPHTTATHISHLPASDLAFPNPYCLSVPSHNAKAPERCGLQASSAAAPSYHPATPSHSIAALTLYQRALVPALSTPSQSLAMPSHNAAFPSSYAPQVPTRVAPYCSFTTLPHDTPREVTPVSKLLPEQPSPPSQLLRPSTETVLAPLSKAARRSGTRIVPDPTLLPDARLSCPFDGCGHTYKMKKEYLRHHRERHSGQPLLRCSCGKTFARRYQRDNHLKISRHQITNGTF